MRSPEGEGPTDNASMSQPFRTLMDVERAMFLFQSHPSVFLSMA